MKKDKAPAVPKLLIRQFEKEAAYHARKARSLKAAARALKKVQAK